MVEDDHIVHVGLQNMVSFNLISGFLLSLTILVPR